MDDEGDEMRQQMDVTLAGLTGKLAQLEQQVSGTVRTVKDSVETVRDTFDLRLQARRRPWVFLAGASAIGFLGGFRLHERGAGKSNLSGRHGKVLPATTPSAWRSISERHDGANNVAATPVSPAAEPGWLTNLGDTFQPEIRELRGIVIGTLLGLAREIVTRKAINPKVRTETNEKKSPTAS